MKAEFDKVLRKLEEYRERINNGPSWEKVGPADNAIRVCEAIVAEAAGYEDRMSWRHLQTKP